MKVVIIDYGAGNVKSVSNAFNRLGIDTLLSDNVGEIQTADRVIFPGVGHAQFAMQQLQAKGLDTLIPQLTQPVLGICLGMQLMCAFSKEGNTKGLGIFDLTVELFDATLKVPHIGWNKALKPATNIGDYYYFVHSYYVPVSKYSTTICNYGIDFCATMQKENFTAMQFHPEKSGTAGEQLLRKFIDNDR